MPKRKILILFAHPRFERSRAQKALVNAIPRAGNIVFRDLYELYPDFNIDIRAEQAQLASHDIIVWQHPFYWYSCPPLLKQWIDLVLTFGWAYGPNGKALSGKRIFNAVTTGGGPEAYRREGHNRFTVQEFLAPMAQTAALCNMEYLPPFLLQGTHRLSEGELQALAGQYTNLLNRLSDTAVSIAEMRQYASLNDWLTSTSTTV